MDKGGRGREEESRQLCNFTSTCFIRPLLRCPVQFSVTYTLTDAQYGRRELKQNPIIRILPHQHPHPSLLQSFILSFSFTSLLSQCASNIHSLFALFAFSPQTFSLPKENTMNREREREREKREKRVNQLTLVEFFDPKFGYLLAISQWQ